MKQGTTRGLTLGGVLDLASLPALAGLTHRLLHLGIFSWPSLLTTPLGRRLGPWSWAGGQLD